MQPGGIFLDTAESVNRKLTGGPISPACLVPARIRCSQRKDRNKNTGTGVSSNSYLDALDQERRWVSQCIAVNVVRQLPDRPFVRIAAGPRELREWLFPGSSDICAHWAFCGLHSRHIWRSAG